MDWQAFGLSVRLSLLTSSILLAIGIPVAYWLAYSRWRWKFIAEAVIALPLVLPPTVLGFYVLVGLGPHSPLGEAYASVTGGMLPFTFQGLLVGSVLFSFPFAVQPFMTSMGGVDRELIEMAWCLGYGRLATFFRVILPLSLPGIISGFVLSFAHTLGEFGVVMMVGGNIPGVTRTISIAIYDNVQGLDYDAAARTSLLLLMISFVILTVIYSFRRNRWVV